MQRMLKEPMETEERDAPAFDFYCERWTHGTRHMTKVERCDYLDLLLHQWTSDGLPADLDVLARLVGYRKGSQISPLVVEKFPVAGDGKRRNARLEEERVKQRLRIRAKRAGAAITNAKKQARKAAATAGGRASPLTRGDVCTDNATLSDTDNATLSVTHRERLACAERNDIVTPPPTTHHPPRVELAEAGNLPPRGADWPETEEQARSVAVNIGADPDYVATIWREHDGIGDYTRADVSGVRIPIRNFASYVKSRWGYRSHRQHETHALEKTKAELRRQGSPQQPSRSPRGQGREGGGAGAGGDGGMTSRDARGQQRGEIPTDVSMDKVKVYRLEDYEHEHE